MRRYFALPGWFVYNCNIWYRRFWKRFMKWKEEKRGPASDLNCTVNWRKSTGVNGDNLARNHSQCKENQSQRVSMYRALLHFLVQPTAKSAIAQSPSAISNIQLPYSIAQQPPVPLIPPLVLWHGQTTRDHFLVLTYLVDANITSHDRLYLLSVTPSPSALGMALQSANWFYVLSLSPSEEHPHTLLTILSSSQAKREHLS